VIPTNKQRRKRRLFRKLPRNNDVKNGDFALKFGYSIQAELATVNEAARFWRMKNTYVETSTTRNVCFQKGIIFAVFALFLMYFYTPKIKRGTSKVPLKIIKLTCVYRKNSQLRFFVYAGKHAVDKENKL